MPWTATQTFQIGASNKLGNLNDAEATQAFHPEVFPNPSNGSFTVLLGAHERTVVATLYDLSGRQLAQRVAGSDTAVLYFDQANLPSGMYLLSVASDEMVTQERIVIR